MKLHPLLKSIEVISSLFLLPDWGCSMKTQLGLCDGLVFPPYLKESFIEENAMTSVEYHLM